MIIILALLSSALFVSLVRQTMRAERLEAALVSIEQTVAECEHAVKGRPE